MAKLRTRRHKVVFARSRGGDAGITFILVILGAFMFIPMYYCVIQSIKLIERLYRLNYTVIHRNEHDYAEYGKHEGDARITACRTVKDYSVSSYS